MLMLYMLMLTKLIATILIAMSIVHQVLFLAEEEVLRVSER